MYNLLKKEKKVLLYVMTILSKDETDNWLMSEFISENTCLVQELIENLLYLKSDEFNSDYLDNHTYVNMCLTQRLQSGLVDYTLNYDEDIWYENNSTYDSEAKDIGEMFLYTIYQYVLEYMQYTEIELDSFIIFGKNLFYETRYETSTLSIEG